MQQKRPRCVYILWRATTLWRPNEGENDMKTVVRAFLLSVLALGLTLSAGEKGNKKDGEGKGGPGGGGMMKRTPELDFVLDHAKDLNLTGDQKKKINDLKDKVETQREKVMKDPENRELMKEVMAAKKSGDEEKLRELHQKVREKMNKGGGEDMAGELFKILQPDQLAKLKELREAEGGPRGGKMAGGKGGGGKAPEGQKPDASKGVPSLFDNEK
jgi:Spy/CpxP family protein refolding chaperone